MENALVEVRIDTGLLSFRRIAANHSRWGISTASGAGERLSTVTDRGQSSWDSSGDMVEWMAGISLMVEENYVSLPTLLNH